MCRTKGLVGGDEPEPIGMHFAADVDSDFRTLRAWTFSKKRVSDHAGRGSNSSSKGTTLRFLTAGKELEMPVRASRNGGLPVLPRHVKKWDVTNVLSSADTGDLVVVYNVEGSSVLYHARLEVKNAKVQPAASRKRRRNFRRLRFFDPPKMGYLVSPAPSIVGGMLGFSFLSTTNDVETFVYDLSPASSVHSKKGSAAVVVKWVSGKPKHVPPGGFRPPVLIGYKSFDGREIPAYVYCPPSTSRRGPSSERGKKSPVVIHPHGGPESFSGGTWLKIRLVCK